MTMGEPIVRHVPQSENDPPGDELAALASVYRFLLDRHAEKAANQGRPEPQGGADGALRTEPDSQ
jgi:hypothetical protein